jgi:hypothetical protein
MKLFTFGFTFGGVAAAAIMGTLAFGAAGGAGAQSPVPPTITVNPNNVMVNTNTTVTGKNFAPDSRVFVAECGKTIWTVPAHPCDTNNALTVTTDASGDFVAPMKVELCPGGVFRPPTSELCYIGVPKPGGLDTIHLVPHASITVTYP